MWIYYLILAVLALLSALVLFWKLYFLRDPHRDITPGSSLVSPADGKVIKIIEYNKEGILVEKGVFGRISIFTKDVAPEGYLVSIFLSPLDVHINRAPMSGEIIYAKHYRGKFFNASDFEKSLQNERNEILIKGGKTKIKVIQLAGFIARRIECFVEDGRKIIKGQRIGLINLGSQVSTIIPKDFEIKVKEGDRVTAGVTIIAEPR